MEASKAMNIDAMQNLLYNFASKISAEIYGSDTHIENFDLEVCVTSSTMFAVKRTLSVNGRSVKKKYTISSDKRIYFSDLTSLPFGY